MSMVWNLDDPARSGSSWSIEVTVDDPGCGRLAYQSFDSPNSMGPVVEFTGSWLGALLDDVTKLALRPDGGSAVYASTSDCHSVRITREQARELLPVLQHAVALAIGGTERYDRIWDGSR